MTIRPLIKIMILAALLAIGTGFLLPSVIIAASSMKFLVNIIASLVPCVSVIAHNAIDPIRAEVTWAVQWMFFPIYLFLWFWVAPVWGKEMKGAALKKSSELPGTGGKRFALLFGILALGTLVLSDAGLINVWSFIRGSVFQGNPSLLPILLRAPFVSKAGMVLYAWLIPLINATAYWMFFMLIVNFKSYFADAREIDLNQKGTASL
jgi:hypothetical protein